MIEDAIAAPALDEIETYSNLVQAAIDARKAMDTGRWLLGNYVRQLITYYAEHTIEQFADEVGVDSRRLYEYGVMASFYPMDARESLSELDLTYSHYREARRLGDLDQAVEFLKTIALNRWTVRQTQDALKSMKALAGAAIPRMGGEFTTTDNRPVNPHRPRPVWEGITQLTVKNGRITFDPGTLPPDFDPERPYKIIIEPIDD